MADPKIFTHPDQESMASALAEQINTFLKTAIHERLRASMMFPGGRSPVSLINKLAASDVHWQEIYLTTSDERCVPFESGDSNAGNLFRQLESLGINPRIHHLVDGLPPQDFPWPADIAILGMGEDGHFASLFPGFESFDSTDILVEGVAPVPPEQRVSFSLHALLSSRKLILLVNSPEKWRICEKSLGEAGSEYPVSRLIKTAGNHLEIHRCC
jgi:6-phosphogluconolactonase